MLIKLLVSLDTYVSVITLSDFFLQSLIGILTKSSNTGKIFIPILNPKYKTLAVMYMVGTGYLLMHQSINLIFEFLLQSALLTLELLFPSFFPLLQQYSLNATFLSFSCIYLIMSQYLRRRTKWLYCNVNFWNIYLVIDIWMKIMYEHKNRKLELYCGFFESLECISETETKKKSLFQLINVCSLHF